jgi:hypothetical protein
VNGNERDEVDIDVVDRNESRSSNNVTIIELHWNENVRCSLSMKLVSSSGRIEVVLIVDECVRQRMTFCLRLLYGTRVVVE